jgi:CRISPR/Cas system CSM-associated protein Csm3 (group 7 of RAMP superfamily)
LISPQALDTSLPWQDISKSVPITPHVGHPVCQIMVKLKPKAPYLSNEIGLVSDTKQAPKLRYARTREGFPMIPARSVKGWVRHQAQKIAATIAHQHFDISAHDAQDCVKNWVDGLFGNDLQRGWLQMSDAVSTEPATQHEQTFNAIDRFTGGVTHLEGQQSLYSVEAALNELQTQIGLDVRLLTEEYNHWKGLLLLVLRDALAGELWLGWGQARGYGEFTLEITLPKNQDTYASEIASDQISHLCDVSALLQHPLITAEGDVWVQALHSALGKHLQSSLPKEPAHA